MGWVKKRIESMDSALCYSKSVAEGHKNKLTMASRWNAVSLHEQLMKSIGQDLLPPDSIAGFFGMGNPGDVNTRVFGVWQGMWRQGLMPRHKVLEVIRENRVKEFFDEGVLKLAARRHQYSCSVLSDHYIFSPLPKLGPDPPQDLVNEVKVATSEAYAAMAAPTFQTSKSQKEAWDRLDQSVLDLMTLPCPKEHAYVLKEALNMYIETDEYFKAGRKPPPELEAYVKQAFPKYKLYESDSDSD